MILAAAPILALACRADAGSVSYRVEVLGSDLVGFGMNSNGIAVGRALIGGSHGAAFVARPADAVELLPLPAEWTSSDAFAIGDDGTIVGAVSADPFATTGSHAVAWYPAGDGYFIWPLGALEGHAFSTALALNNLGDIVGASGGGGADDYSNAVLFWNSQIIDLPGIGVPVDVNDHRIVLGTESLFDLETMAPTVIPRPPAEWQAFVPSDLADDGSFCGRLVGDAACPTQAGVHRPSGWSTPGPCADDAIAVSMNDGGDALIVVAPESALIAFDGEGAVEIASLIAPSEGAWEIVGAVAINASRQILCMGRPSSGGETQLLRLDPVLGDLDGDGDVDGADLGSLLGEWGACPGCDADFNGDGVVDGNDLGALLGAWTG